MVKHIFDCFFHFPNRPKYARLKGFRRFSLSCGANTVYAPKSSAIPTSLYPDIWFCGGVNLYVGRCVRETPPARQRHGALTVQPGFVRGGVRETPLILPCSAGKSNRVQADFLPAPCFAYPLSVLCVSAPSDSFGNTGAWSRWGHRGKTGELILLRRPAAAGT